jgi:hypothetical protein
MSDDTVVEPDDRYLVGSQPATELRVLDVVEMQGTRMARVESGRHDTVRWRTPVSELEDKLERGRYRRIESR